ncbi:head scaffolding protein [Bacillus phage Mgbh1]|uniref:Capsid protein-like protein n=1 Tax=Bacillus phage Mgbh1 TaxID=1796993 RepID=A0A142F1L8_9CAUD|nr:head scaffolding protein [Bacillus phage Mgbh1]AMQ66675.1 capsid protein-like protein [Bacillus phage Mgbh1]
MEKRKFYLPLNLQFFSEPSDPSDGGQVGAANDPDDLSDPEGGDEGASKGGKPKIEFTPEQQAEVNRIIQDRLDRERKRREEDLEQKRLEEENEFKKLYEKTKKKLEEIEAERAEDKRNSIITKKLLAAGYKEDQIDRLSKYVEGEDESEISASISQLTEDIPPKSEPADPSAGPSGKHKETEPADGTEIGKELFAKIRGKKR